MDHHQTDAGREQPSLAVPPLDDTRRQRHEVMFGAAVLAAGVIGDGRARVELPC